MIDVIYQYPILSTSIVAIILSIIAAILFTFIGSGIAKRKRIKAIKELLKECEDFNPAQMSVELFRSNLIKLKNQIKFCPNVSYEFLETSEEQINKKIHDIDLENAQKSLKNLEENPIMTFYNAFMCYIDRGVLFSELRVTRQRVEELKRTAQIQNGLLRLENNTIEKENIWAGLKKEGLTEKDLYPEENLG